MTIWPQIVYVSLSLVGLGFAIAKHGQPREPYNAFGLMIGTALSWTLLWWGGFFQPLLSR